MSHDLYGFPLVPHRGSYYWEIEQQDCVIIPHRQGEWRGWSVRGRRGGPIAAGRTVAQAIREARRVLQEREP